MKHAGQGGNAHNGQVITTYYSTWPLILAPENVRGQRSQAI